MSHSVRSMIARALGMKAAIERNPGYWFDSDTYIRTGARRVKVTETLADKLAACRKRYSPDLDRPMWVYSDFAFYMGAAGMAEVMGVGVTGAVEELRRLRDAVTVNPDVNTACIAFVREIAAGACTAPKNTPTGLTIARNPPCDECASCRARVFLAGF